MKQTPTSGSWLLPVIGFLFSGCMALPFLIPPLLQFGANLLHTAVNNYGDTHEQNMQNMLVSLQAPTNPAGQEGLPVNPYQNDPYQQVGEYPSSQGYPTSQDNSQAPYDPYQDQQQRYGGNTPYAYDQYPDQSQPGYPDSNYPNYAAQPQASAPGYSTYPPTQYPQQVQQPPPYPTTPHPYSDQGHPYPAPSYPLDHQGQSHPNPYANTRMEAGSASLMHSGDLADLKTTPISLDVLLVKKHMVNGVQSYLPIKDGDVLRDGRGNPKAGDKFRVMFRPHTDCYVYIIAVDGSAWAQGLFPSASAPFANPVKAGQQYVLPEGTNWFSLDQYQGIETIFFVASKGRRTDIEDILNVITGRERSPLEKPHAVSEPAIIPNGYSGTRPGSTPFAVHTSQQQQKELLPTTYFVKTAGEDLRITRWFRHQ
jgi:hypothetical protein